MHRLLRVLPLLFVLGWTAACVEIPEVEAPPAEPLPDGGGADAGSTPEPDAGETDAGEQPIPSFTLGVTPLEDSVLQGESRAFQVSISRMGGFSSSVSVALVDPPGGISAQPAVVPVGGTTASLRVSVSSSATPGTATLSIRATSGALSEAATVTLEVVKLGDLAVRWTTPSESKVYVNGALSLEIMLEGGSAEAVELMRGSNLLARLASPPFTYTWDTTAEPEGEYELTARAIRGTSVFASPVRVVVVDRTAPQVTARTPAHGAAQVGVRASVEATFSEPVRSSTVTASNVQLLASSGANLDTSLSLSQDGRRLTISPASPLPVSSTVTVGLGTSGQPVTDLAGNALAATTAWTFTVPAWLPMGGAISANPGSTPAENVVLKLGADGMPVIAWSEFDGSVKNIHVARWNGSSWHFLGPALSSLSGAGTDAERPALHVDASGQLLVAWDERTGNGFGRNSYSKKRTNNGWEDLPSLSLTGSSETYVSSPLLATSPNGSISKYVHYFNGATSELRGFILAPGAPEWSPLSIPLPPGQHSRAPEALIIRGPTVFVAYLAYFDAFEKRAVGVLRNNQAISDSGILASPLDSSGIVASLAVNGNGDPLVAWEEAVVGSTNGKIYFSQWIGTEWQRPELVSGASSSNTAPALAQGNDGHPVLAWSGFSSPERTIYVSRRSGSTWESVGAPLNALAGANTPGSNPSLALDRDDQPIIAWHESDGSVTNIHVYRYNH